MVVGWKVSDSGTSPGGRHSLCGKNIFLRTSNILHPVYISLFALYPPPVELGE
ncbi:hypothetical protein A2U01_0029420, partial [Trifolium medium]|nr:hypothetical protein [Trifolium medium]